MHRHRTKPMNSTRLKRKPCRREKTRKENDRHCVVDEHLDGLQSAGGKRGWRV